MIAGMDFGTTHSGMAVYDGQQLRNIPLNKINPHDRVTPTVLYITNEQKISFGREATNTYFEQNLGRPSKLERVWVGEISQTFAETGTYIRDVYIWIDVLSPGRLFLSFKTDLSDASYTGTAIGRFFYTLEDIATTYLYTAKQRAEQFLGQELNEIVLGRPVRFNDNPEADALAQARLLDAALQAGYKRVYFEYEPIAAAHYYETTINRPQNVLIFDFGGGTLDITVMRLGEGDGPQVLSTGGVPIAGDIFDRKIVRAKLPKIFGEGSSYNSRDKKLPVPNWIYDAFGDWRTLLTLQQPENLQTLRTIAPTADQKRAIEALIKLVTSNYSLKLFEVVEGVKRRLSEVETAFIRLQGDGFFVREQITRIEFEQIIRPEYNIIERHLDETVRNSGLRPDQIDVVIRTGGSSQIPLFQRMLAQKFGAEKVQALDIFGSVTAGLGVIGHRLAQGEIEKPGYTQSSKIQLPSSGKTAQIPTINLELLKQQIAWQEGVTEADRATLALVSLTHNYELSVVEQPAHLLQQEGPQPVTTLELPTVPLLTLLAVELDESLLIVTSQHRLILITPRTLLHQQHNGITLAQLHGFVRNEQICCVYRWAALKFHEYLLFVSTQGYVRRFEMAQIRPSIESPTPTKLDWTLPGWPRLLIGADGDTDLTLLTVNGRGVRVPVPSIRRTGSRVLHKSKPDDISGGAAIKSSSWLWLLSDEGYSAWLQPEAVTTVGESGGPSVVAVRRRGELCAVLAKADQPRWVLTSKQLLRIDPAATPREGQSMQKALTLAKGEAVLGVVQ